MDTIRLAGSLLVRDLENKRIARVMSLQRVQKGGGSSQSDTQNKKTKKQMHDQSAVFAEE